MRTSFPVEKIRADFPILKESNRGKPLAYLDNAASSQKPKCVIDSISRFYKQANSNVHRGIYQLAEKAEHEYTQARETIASWFSVNTHELIFTRGTTEALNLVANSYGQTALRSGDCIILTEMEHHANIVPWQLTAQKTGARFCGSGSCRQDRPIGKSFPPPENPGKQDSFSLPYFQYTWNDKSLDQIIGEAKQNGVKVVVDGAQSAPHHRIDLKSLDCDFFAFSGTKHTDQWESGSLWKNGTSPRNASLPRRRRHD